MYVCICVCMLSVNRSTVPVNKLNQPAYLQFDEVPDKDDLIGTEDSARRSGIPPIAFRWAEGFTVCTCSRVCPLVPL